MADKEFNLLDEKWIRVIDDKCGITEVSLKEVFRSAHLYKDLCGELPTQDFAMLRLLLAVLHTVFSRYDSDGNESPLEEPDDALDRWKELWDNKKFPEKPIIDYLESYRESFYLFHPERPFYQVEKAKIGTEYKNTAKLNGCLSESNNKVRLFQNISGQTKKAMKYSEAARWLIYVNSFDDVSSKQPAESKKVNGKLPALSVGWLGQLGLICNTGNNLFETLMLNFLLLNRNDELYDREIPIWERETIPDNERSKIVVPNNLSQLYTLQSRRLFLKKADKKVTGYYLLGGDFFDKENAFIEPMTVWRQAQDKSKEKYIPKEHNHSRQFWRDFPLYTMSGKFEPGVIIWEKALVDRMIIKDSFLTFKIASVIYDKSQAASLPVLNVYSDSFMLHSSLISKMDLEWQTMIQNSIEFCENISKKVWTLAKDVNIASGGDFIPKEDKCSAKVAANKAVSDFYARIDVPFRKWLCSLDPTVDIASDRQTEWRKKCVDIAKKLGEDIIGSVPSSAIFGKLKNGESDKPETVSAAEAHKWFIIGINKVKKDRG